MGSGSPGVAYTAVFCPCVPSCLAYAGHPRTPDRSWVEPSKFVLTGTSRQTHLTGGFKDALQHFRSRHCNRELHCSIFVHSTQERVALRRFRSRCCSKETFTAAFSFAVFNRESCIAAFSFTVLQQRVALRHSCSRCCNREAEFH